MDAQPRLAGGMPNGRRSIGQMAHRPGDASSIVARVRLEPLCTFDWTYDEDVRLPAPGYVMVSPYTARGYGIYDEVKGKFKNPEDPFEYIQIGRAHV